MALKQKNPSLVTMLSIGGWNSGSEQWSWMASDPEKRRIFVDSVIRSEISLLITMILP